VQDGAFNANINSRCAPTLYYMLRNMAVNRIHEIYGSFIINLLSSNTTGRSYYSLRVSPLRLAPVNVKNAAMVPDAEQVKSSENNGMILIYCNHLYVFQHFNEPGFELNNPDADLEALAT
jgi:hypothetical protein